MLQGRRDSAEVFTEGIGAADHSGILWGLREIFGDGDGIQIPWEGTHVIGWLIAGGGCKPAEGAEAVGAALVDSRTGGGRPS